MPQVRVSFGANLGPTPSRPVRAENLPHLLFFPVAAPVWNAIVATAKLRGISLNGRTQ